MQAKSLTDLPIRSNFDVQPLRSDPNRSSKSDQRVLRVVPGARRRRLLGVLGGQWPPGEQQG
eukprot:7854229-Alexandrium_andersonii.AAC.1